MPMKILVRKYVAPLPRIKSCMSPAEKFSRLSKRLASKGKGHKLRKFHFTVIASGALITVFDGDGIEVIRASNNIDGYRIARAHAIRLFLASDQHGGFDWNSPNVEYQTPEELAATQQQTIRDLSHHPLAICKDCKFDFSDQLDLRKHKCSEQWMILEFSKVKRIYL
jgi:hypothetical protein